MTTLTNIRDGFATVRDTAGREIGAVVRTTVARAVNHEHNHAVWPEADETTEVVRDTVWAALDHRAALAFEMGAPLNSLDARHFPTRAAAAAALVDDDDQPDMLTGPQVAAMLGITSSTWRAYQSRGQAPAPDSALDGRTPLWRRATIEDWSRSRPRVGQVIENA